MTESVWRTNEENKAYVAKLSWISNPLYLKKKDHFCLSYYKSYELWLDITLEIQIKGKQNKKYDGLLDLYTYSFLF